MWSDIRHDATTKSQMHKVDTHHHLQDARCDEGGDIQTHLYTLTQTRDELAGMGVDITNQEFLTIILGSLPPSYRMLLSTVTLAASVTNMMIEPNDLI